ncbi:hypothetical protein DFH06DRAFT_1428336 [Mycena polygramma]|nr:hypothetical protein DFH06DRAFT_1428336 [Mycena polygramma]
MRRSDQNLKSQKRENESQDVCQRGGMTVAATSTAIPKDLTNGEDGSDEVGVRICSHESLECEIGSMPDGSGTTEGRVECGIGRWSYGPLVYARSEDGRIRRGSLALAGSAPDRIREEARMKTPTILWAAGFVAAGNDGRVRKQCMVKYGGEAGRWGNNRGSSIAVIPRRRHLDEPRVHRGRMRIFSMHAFTGTKYDRDTRRGITAQMR